MVSRSNTLPFDASGSLLAGEVKHPHETGLNEMGLTEMGLPEWELLLTPEQRLNLLADLLVEMATTNFPDQ